MLKVGEGSAEGGAGSMGGERGGVRVGCGCGWVEGREGWADQGWCRHTCGVVRGCSRHVHLKNGVSLKVPFYTTTNARRDETLII